MFSISSKPTTAAPSKPANQETAALLPCPMCGSDKGYNLDLGSTYRWWNVECNGCGRVLDQCRSDRRSVFDTKLPKRWPAADKVWNEAAAHAYNAVTASIATTNPTRGRPTKPADQQTKPYSVRLTDARIAKLKALGSDWLNRAIDRAKIIVDGTQKT